MVDVDAAQHAWMRWDNAFSGVAAYVVLDGAEVFAKVGIKYAKSGLTTQAHLHVMSFTPSHGRASGGGYDKESAAIGQAAGKVDVSHLEPSNRYRQLVEAMRLDDGRRWDGASRDAGFTVIQVL